MRLTPFPHYFDFCLTLITFSFVLWDIFILVNIPFVSYRFKNNEKRWEIEERDKIENRFVISMIDAIISIAFEVNTDLENVKWNTLLRSEPDSKCNLVRIPIVSLDSDPDVVFSVSVLECQTNQCHSDPFQFYCFS